jgi:hypothetical protein
VEARAALAPLRSVVSCPLFLSVVPCLSGSVWWLQLRREKSGR